MPARRLAFTEVNIRSAWEAVGIIPFNPRREIGGVKRKDVNVTQEKDLAGDVGPKIPKTPRAVSRITRTAAALVTRNSPASQKLKELLSNLSTGFQQTIADKAVEEEAYRQYRQLMAKEKKKKTSDRRKLTEATVVTSETILMLRKERERVDAAKSTRLANQQARLLKTLPATKSPSAQRTPTLGNEEVLVPSGVDGIAADEMEDLWEEMEALEVSGERSGEEAGVGVGDTIRVERRH